MSGKLTLISSAVVTSPTSTVDFTSGIDSTYDEYQFWFFGVKDSAQNELRIVANDGGWGVVKTSTFFQARQHENGSTSALEYLTGHDQAQSTGQLHITKETESLSDDQMCGCFQLFNPSSTTKVKHFMSRAGHHNTSGGPGDVFVAGYYNTTSAITGIRFDPGNTAGGDTISRGEFYLFGVS